MWMKEDVAIAGADHEVQMAAGIAQSKTIIGRVGGGGKSAFIHGWVRPEQQESQLGDSVFLRMVEWSSGKSSAWESAGFES